ncbi:MAG: S8 family serine peptidase [Planctomycetia bacterium]
MKELNRAERGRGCPGILRSLYSLAVLALLLAATSLPMVCRGETASGLARGEYVAGPYPTGPFTFVNDAAGAGLFYNSGFYGGSTVIGNVEAGYIWDGHQVFDRSGLGLGPAVEQKVAGTGVAGAYDFHATMVGHVLAGTGYVAATGSTAAGYSYIGMGMAPQARLWSGAIATAFSTSTASIGSFDTTPASTISVYRQFFQGISGTACDVINSSYGGPDPAATEPEYVALDALAFQNPNVTFVAAAGNGDVDPVSAPGDIYNGITVGSVGGTSFRTPSDFSSRGAVDFYNPATNTTLTGVRAAVDIAAAGEQGFLAAYLGPTGGLGPFPQYTQNPSPTDLFFTNMDGTSFASPTVAGGVALMKDAAKSISFVPDTALDSRVVKAVLMATSARTDGWNNGQSLVNGVVRTTQALDWATGAGALDLTTAGFTYVNGATMDVSGTGGGSIGSNGWDLGALGVGSHADYMFSATLAASTELQVALDWFANGTFTNATDTGTRNAFANLDLQVWSVINGVFDTLVAESASLYNNAEFLRFALPAGGLYGLRVMLPSMVYDMGSTPVTTETYGLAWKTVIVPEPSAAAIAACGIAIAVAAASRRLTSRATRG